MTDTPERSYDGCPREGLGYLHLWRAGVAYAELAEATPDWMAVVQPEHGAPMFMTADAMSFHHFFTFWGAVDGRL